MQLDKEDVKSFEVTLRKTWEKFQQTVKCCSRPWKRRQENARGWCVECSRDVGAYRSARAGQWAHTGVPVGLWQNLVGKAVGGSILNYFKEF